MSCNEKKRFGKGGWNGVGGKREDLEGVGEATVRETKEEIEFTIKELKKVTELTFLFPHNPEMNKLVHVFFSEKWESEPEETEEMKPKWFKVDSIPFPKMWPDDIFWLPEVLKGKFVTATFVFGEKNIILKKEINLK